MTASTTTAEGLRRTALEQFARSGYLATSIQQIADAAGVSKASVLYHYESKEQLLEAVLQPTIDELERLIPATKLSMEQQLEFCREDECLEVTPDVVRIRKTELNAHERAKARTRAKHS